MQSTATTVEQYLDELPEERKEGMRKLRQIIRENLPEGFAETMSYGMISYVVPYTLYPAGYHCDPKQALPFLSIASQKNFIAVYHMVVYADKSLYDWFVKAYTAQSKTKLDMGKSCIRFKKPEHIPYELIGELAQKVEVADWIGIYEENFKKNKKS